MLSTLAFFAAPGTAAAADPVIAAAGDIACASFTATPTKCQQQATSDLLVGAGYDKVLSLGDQQYENGSLSLFNTYYDASWGRVKAITAPVPGNHEYQTSGASGYYDYFGALAGPRGKGYYSFNLGNWHLVGLNSNCSKVSCSAGSLQEQWLRADLAANPRQCVLGFFHHATSTAPTTALRQALFDAGGDVILTGHNHNYKRHVLRDASLNANPAGYREFVVGTGGVGSSPFGVLQLTLHSASYDWRFIKIDRSSGDTGSASCSPGASPLLTAAFSATPRSGTAPLSVNFTDQSSGSPAPSSWAWDFQNDGLVDSNVQNPSFQYTAPGTYSVKLSVVHGSSTNSLTQTGYITVAPPGGGGTSVTYLPSGDAYVRLPHPDENNGAATTLRAYKSGTSAQTDSFLKFAVGAPAGSVSSAKLRLFVTDASPNGGLLYTAESNWSESTLTWNLRPAFGTSLLASAGAVAVGTWIELDVTSIVTGAGTYSFVLRGASSDVAYYGSEESANKPQLVVTTSG